MCTHCLYRTNNVGTIVDKNVYNIMDNKRNKSLFFEAQPSTYTTPTNRSRFLKDLLIRNTSLSSTSPERSESHQPASQFSLRTKRKHRASLNQEVSLASRQSDRPKPPIKIRTGASESDKIDNLFHTLVTLSDVSSQKVFDKLENTI